MNKEEIKKAKELIKESFLKEKYCVTDNTLKQAIETIFEYIDKLEQDNSKQNKMINEIAKMLEELKLAYFKKDKNGDYHCYNKNEWIEYFEKKVEDEHGE